jgi:hypothetical protein
MKSKYDTNDTQPVTFGDLCEALADSELPAAVKDGFYMVRKGDLKRFVREASGEQTPLMMELFMPMPVQAAG